MTDPYLNSLLASHEKIILESRQHWFVLVQSLLVEIILVIATIVLIILSMVFVASNPVILLAFLFLLIPIASGIRDFLIFYNHKYVITTHRVIQVFGIINKNVTDSSLEKVNDVHMDQSFWGRLFNFGDIEILTASEMGINRFTTIGDPIQFKTAMLNSKHHLEEQPGRVVMNPGGSNIPKIIDEMDNLRKRGILTEGEFQAKKQELLNAINPDNLSQVKSE